MIPGPSPRGWSTTVRRPCRRRHLGAACASGPPPSLGPSLVLFSFTSTAHAGSRRHRPFALSLELLVLLHGPRQLLSSSRRLPSPSALSPRLGSPPPWPALAVAQCCRNARSWSAAEWPCSRSTKSTLFTLTSVHPPLRPPPREGGGTCRVSTESRPWVVSLWDTMDRNTPSTLATPHDQHLATAPHAEHAARAPR